MNSDSLHRALDKSQPSSNDEEDDFRNFRYSPLTPKEDRNYDSEESKNSPAFGNEDEAMSVDDDP